MELTEFRGSIRDHFREFLRSGRLVVLENFRGTGTTGIVRNDFWILTPPRGIVRNFRDLRFQDPAKPAEFFFDFLRGFHIF